MFDYESPDDGSEIDDDTDIEFDPVALGALYTPTSVRSLTPTNSIQQNTLLLTAESTSLPQDHSPIPALTPSQQVVLERALEGLEHEVVIQRFGIPITRWHLQTLCSNERLNDEIVNFLVNRLQRISRERDQSNFFHNTFFYGKLSENSYNSVSRWTKRSKVFSNTGKSTIFEIEKLFIPVFLKSIEHFLLVVVDMAPKGAKVIRLYDSMSSRVDALKRKVLDNVRSYLEKEYEHKVGGLVKPTFVEEVVEDIPRQADQTSCGVYAVSYAMALLENTELSFDPKDVPNLRAQLALQIIQEP